MADSNNASVTGSMRQTEATTSVTSHITTTTSQPFLSTSTYSAITSTPGFFDSKLLSDAWDHNKVTLTWLIPVIVVIVVLLAMLSLGMFYTIRGVELWVLKCCYRHCGCCPQPSRRLRSEYTHLTDALHDDDGITLTEFDRTDHDLSRCVHTGKED